MLGGLARIVSDISAKAFLKIFKKEKVLFAPMLSSDIVRERPEIKIDAHTIKITRVNKVVVIKRICLRTRTGFARIFSS